MAMEDLDPMTREEFGYKEQAGVRVTALVPDSPAVKAGLQKDDIVIRYKGEKVTSMRRLIALIQQSRVGDEVSIEVWREGTKHTLTATIGEADNFDLEKARQGIDTETILHVIGIEVRTPTPIEQRNGLRGLIITQIKSHSKLKGKLVTGDVIRAVNGRLVTSVKDFYARLVASVSSQNTQLTIQRGRTIIELTVSPLRSE